MFKSDQVLIFSVIIFQFQDTLACLASDEIKLASLKTRHDDIGEIDGAPDVEGAVASAVKKAIISQVNFCRRLWNLIFWKDYHNLKEFEIHLFIHFSMSKPM